MRARHALHTGYPSPALIGTAKAGCGARRSPLISTRTPGGVVCRGSGTGSYCCGRPTFSAADAVGWAFKQPFIHTPSSLLSRPVTLNALPAPRREGCKAAPAGQFALVPIECSPSCSFHPGLSSTLEAHTGTLQPARTSPPPSVSYSCCRSAATPAKFGRAD